MQSRPLPNPSLHALMQTLLAPRLQSEESVNIEKKSNRYFTRCMS